jgi:hypothetical protein
VALHAFARQCAGIDVALQHAMALFWETTLNPKPPVQKPTPLSPLAIALLLKLQSEVARKPS